jgi:excisionase family DNA binding protein
MATISFVVRSSSDDDPLISVAKAAALLGVDRSTFWRWISKGSVPIERVGPFRLVRVRLSVVEQMKSSE